MKSDAITETLGFVDFRIRHRVQKAMHHRPNSLDSEALYVREVFLSDLKNATYQL
jgi:hypothetical protein